MLLSLLCLCLAAGAATAAWPAVQAPLEEAMKAAGRADARLLLLAGLLFTGSSACCGLVWHLAIARAGGELGRVDACARYGVGSFVNSFAPAHLGDLVRTALLLEALPAGGRCRIVRCFGAVQGVRITALAGLALAALLPVEFVLPAVLLLLVAGLSLLGRDARRLLTLSLLAPAAKVGAVAVGLAALDTHSPLRAAFAVVPALELAALLPLTPGNIGLASAAATMALHARGIEISEAVPAGILLHAVETSAGVCYGAASASMCLARLWKRRRGGVKQRGGDVTAPSPNRHGVVAHGPTGTPKNWPRLAIYDREGSLVKRSRILALAAVAAGAVAAAAVAAPGGSTGPSSSQSPYLVHSQPGVVLKSIVTVGDGVPKPGGGSYRMVGIPDGLGAFDNGDGTFTVLMNHELTSSAGAVRAHGATGAFVSKWTIRKDDLAVVGAEDLIQQIATWNSATSSYNAPTTGVALGRLCSANLPPISALYNAASGKGYPGRIFMDGEEVGAEGRAFAHLLNGTSYELPALGKFSWENSVAHPEGGDKTVVVGLDDSTPGQVYVYVGEKRAAGNPAERAGLTGGTLYGIKVAGFPAENTATGIPSGTAFSAESLGDVSNWTGAQLETASSSAGVTVFNRPEDGAWDPTSPNDFYFVTTASFSGASRLWRLHFDDPTDPAAGGTISMLLDGTETGGTAERFHMLDNITVNGHGQVIAQEDPGNQAYLARVWQYDIASDTLTQIAEHDPARFAPSTPAPFNQDEESSGVIDVSSILGEGWYLLDVQAHYANSDPELVEGGQLLALHLPPGKFPQEGS